jgi:hypothetical protein
LAGSELVERRRVSPYRHPTTAALSRPPTPGA